MATNRIYALQSLRGLAASAIFIHHAGYLSAVNASVGVFSVLMFFGLSGFLMSYHYSGRVNSPGFNFRAYIWRKLAKIYPMNIVGALLSVPLMLWLPAPMLVGGLAVNLLMIQGWVLDSSLAMSCNGPAWTQSCTIFFYFVFPFLVRQAWLSPRCFVVVALSAMGVYLAVVPCLPAGLIQDVIYLFPVMRLPDFVLGMLVWMAARRWRFGAGWNRSVIEVGVVSVTVAFVVVQPAVPACYREVAWWWLPAALMLYTFATDNSRPGVVSRLLSFAPLVAVGNMSMAFYLLHYPVLGLGHKLLGMLGILLPKGIEVLLLYAVTVALSIPSTALFVKRIPALLAPRREFKAA